jgi:tRNA dimethylallyltransferase
MAHKVLFVVGPTASGKTKLAIEIAKLLSGEIISADSRQVYQLLDIGTAKPTLEEMRAVPHHLVDIYEPTVAFNAGKFSREARVIIDQLQLAGKQPIVVGGSGLYIKALISGFTVEQVGDERIRAALQKRVEEGGSESLYKELKEIDPISAAEIHPNNTHRLIRAMEIYLLTGLPMSEQKQQKEDAANFEPIIYGLNWEREKLYRRIDLRVDKMINDGLIAEVAILKRKGIDETLNSLQTVGYKEVFEYFNGDCSYSEMIEKIKKNSRNYAKRQMTWFRNSETVNWIDVDYTSDFSAIAADIVADFKKRNTNS